MSTSKTLIGMDVVERHVTVHVTAYTHAHINEDDLIRIIRQALIYDLNDPVGVIEVERFLGGKESGKRITHGRHCECSACAREDWTNPDYDCGMHPKGCAHEYQPWGRPGALVPDNKLRKES